MKRVREAPGVKKVFVLNDKQTYGFGVASTYRSAAKKLGISVVGFQGWDAKQSSYEALANWRRDHPGTSTDELAEWLTQFVVPGLEALMADR